MASLTAIYIRATPKRRWSRDTVYAMLNGLYNLADFKKLGYSIEPPHPMADRKEIGLNIVFKSKNDKKKFIKIGLTQYYWSQIEKFCKDGLVVRTSDDG